MQKTFHPLMTALVSVLDEVQEMANNESDANGIRTGFENIDSFTSGFLPGDLIVLAGRPSMGKTALAINMAEHICVSEGLPVAYFTIESTAHQLAQRAIASFGNINIRHIRTGKLRDDEWPRLTEAIEKLRHTNFLIDESSALTIQQIRERALNLNERCGKVGLLIVDYLQLMNGMYSSMNIENRSSELSAISRGLKALAKDLGCPILAISQLNRSVEQRDDRRPVLSDLRDSGSIEDDADVVMFIYRNDYYFSDSREPGIAEIIIAKQRNGPTGSVKLRFSKDRSKFSDISS